MNPGRVLIVGGGSAGLTAAINLRNGGWDVEVSELRRGAVGGAALGLSSNALKPLRDIGLLDAVLAASTPNLHYHVCDYRGQTIVDIVRPQPDELGFPVNIVITRRDLNRILVAGAEKAGARFTHGCQIESIEQDADGVRVTFADGRKERYDAVIGSDGVGSTVRRLVWGHMEVGAVGQYGLRWMTPERLSMTRGAFYVGKAGTTLGLFPVSEGQTYVVLTLPKEGNFTTRTVVGREEILACLNEEFEGQYARDVAAGLPEASEIHGGYYPSILVESPWHRGRVVLIGDAAHAMPPYSSSGAAMAIEDGAVLAEELKRAADWNAAMDGFTKRRWPRVRAVFEMAMDRVPRQEEFPGSDAYSAATLDKIRTLWNFLLEPV